MPPGKATTRLTNSGADETRFNQDQLTSNRQVSADSVHVRDDSHLCRLLGTWDQFATARQTRYANLTGVRAQHIIVRP